MGFLDGFFGGNSESENNTTTFHTLEFISQLDEIDALSQTKPIVIFKHSTRCSISRFALKRFEAEYNYDITQIETYVLDLIQHRDVSNEIAYRYKVQHQSPQILIIKEGKAVYTDSHDGIDANDLKGFV